MNKQARESFFQNTDPKMDAKGFCFWNACKPFFGDKGAGNGGRFLLVEDNNIILSKDVDIASVFNNYFNNIISSLPIQKWDDRTLQIIHEPVVRALEKYKNHPSILAITTKNVSHTPFEFCYVIAEEVYDVIVNLNSSKKTSGDVPTKILKAAAKTCAPVLASIFNTCLDHCNFPEELKMAEVIPIHKKNAATDKSNYRPISLLPSVSKVFEKLVFTQLLQFIQASLFKHLCGFRKGYSTQYALLHLLTNWQKVLSNGCKVGAILLMDLSKAFDCLPHDLLVAKLKAYGMGYKVCLSF